MREDKDICPIHNLFFESVLVNSGAALICGGCHLELEKELASLREKYNQLLLAVSVPEKVMSETIAQLTQDLKVANETIAKYRKEFMGDGGVGITNLEAELKVMTEKAVESETDNFKLDEELDHVKRKLSEAQAALKPIAEEIRNTGNLYKESDWNPEAHIDKPITLTVKEARAILTLTEGGASKPDYYYEGDGITYNPEVDAEATCWHCKKTFLCDMMDATCRLCHAPFDKKRCKEFGFEPKEGGAHETPS